MTAKPPPRERGRRPFAVRGRQLLRRRLISASARSRTASMLFSAVSRICLTARVTSEPALLAELFALRPVPLAEFRLRVAAAFFAAALRCAFVCATWEFSSSVRATYWFCPVSARANANAPLAAGWAGVDSNHRPTAGGDSSLGSDR